MPPNTNLHPFYIKFKNEIILAFGIILFIVLTILQIQIYSNINGWQGIIAQFQVMVSVFLVIGVKKNGYMIVVFMNSFVFLITLAHVIVEQDVHAIAGIVIPLCTIITVSIISLYRRKLNNKAKEVIEERSQRSKEIVELQEVSIMAMAALAETRDNETGRHLQRTKLYVKVLAEYLYVNKQYKDIVDHEMIELIVTSAPLHDIGKVGIPDAILLKPGRLTKEEFEVIKLHTTLGYEALMKAENLIGADTSFLRFAQDIILYHHERWDGTGYIHSLSGVEIPIAARIMSVADVYDALTTKRCYKEIHSHKEATAIISQGSGTQFDPVIVEAFLSCNTEFSTIAKNYNEEDI